MFYTLFQGAHKDWDGGHDDDHQGATPVDASYIKSWHSQQNHPGNFKVINLLSLLSFNCSSVSIQVN